METRKPVLVDEWFAHANEIERLAAVLGALLHGKGDVIQGGVIADLIARYLVGFPKAEREPQLQLIVATARMFIAPNEHELFGDAGHPADRH